MRNVYEGKWKLWLLYGLALVFLSSCQEGRVADMGPPEVSEQRHEEAVSKQQGEQLSQEGMRVEGAPVLSAKPEEVVSWRSASGFLSKADGVTVAAFNPLPESALKKLQAENLHNMTQSTKPTPVRLGVNRKASTEASKATPFVLNWQKTEDGSIAKLTLTSPDARRIRVALQLHALPDNAELRFAGSAEPERVIGVISGKKAKALRNTNQVYWTPSTEGETQNIEIYLPSTVATQAVDIRLEGVSHIFTSARDHRNAAASVEMLVVGNSLPCHVDTVCKFAGLGTAFENASKATARVEFITDNGLLHCSGTLLNNSMASGEPYFFSAAHCIDTQDVADTVETFWFEEASLCGDNTSVNFGNIRHVDGGAQILHVRVDTDTLLLRLNNAPPAGAFFSGWDSTRFLNGDMLTLHHPAWDIKKVSTGTGVGVCSLAFPGIPGLNSATLTQITYTEGTTQGGSSGGGLFTLSGGQYLLRGGNVGGGTSNNNTCLDVTTVPKCSSSLNAVWNDIRQWLDPATAPVLVNGTISNITATSADLSITSDQNATAYWVVLLATEPAPTAAQIVAAAGGNTGAMTANTAFLHTLSNLSSKKAYQLYFVASSNGLLSDVWSQAFTTLPLPIVDVPDGVDGRTLTPAQTGDTVNWVEIARNGNYSLIVRTKFINIHSNKTVYDNEAWQHTSFGSSSNYMTATNSIRQKLNAWFNNTAQGDADKLPANARLRDFTVQANVGQVLGTSSWSASVNDGFSKPSQVLAGTGNDIAFALSYGEAANFVSLLHFVRGITIANQPSSAIAQANFAKVSIPTSYAYYGMWLRSPGDLANTAAFLSSSFSQAVPGRVFQAYLSDPSTRGLLYPAAWVDEQIFN